MVELFFYFFYLFSFVLYLVFVAFGKNLFHVVFLRHYNAVIILFVVFGIIRFTELYSVSVLQLSPVAVFIRSIIYFLTKITNHRTY